MKAYIIKKEFLTVCSDENTQEYLLLELNSKVGVVRGKTTAEVVTLGWLKVQALGLTDFEIFLLNH